MNKNNVLIMIPSYNEGDVINLICEKIHKLNPLYNILIIDDGSKPAINLTNKLSSVYLYTSPYNYGLGVSTNIALNFMLKYDYDFLVRIDGDNQHPIDSIPSLIEELNKGSDMCIGARVNADIGSGLRQKLSNYVRKYFNFMARKLISKNIPNDLSSGFMAFNRSSASFLSKQVFERYPEPEIIMLIARNKFIISEVKISQLPRLDGNSTIGYYRALFLVYKFNIFILNHLFDKVINKCKL
tara:strand:+ start:74 stop:796 length:723 start_codon:yes stop_codon:yes gene_type:complete